MAMRLAHTRLSAEEFESLLDKAREAGYVNACDTPEESAQNDVDRCWAIDKPRNYRKVDYYAYLMAYCRGRNAYFARR